MPLHSSPEEYFWTRLRFFHYGPTIHQTCGYLPSRRAQDYTAHIYTFYTIPVGNSMLRSLTGA